LGPPVYSSLGVASSTAVMARAHRAARSAPKGRIAQPCRAARRTTGPQIGPVDDRELTRVARARLFTDGVSAPCDEGARATASVGQAVAASVKWTRNTVELAVAAIVFAHVGTLIIVGALLPPVRSLRSVHARLALGRAGERHPSLAAQRVRRCSRRDPCRLQSFSPSGI